MGGRRRIGAAVVCAAAVCACSDVIDPRADVTGTAATVPPTTTPATTRATTAPSHADGPIVELLDGGTDPRTELRVRGVLGDAFTLTVRQEEQLGTAVDGGRVPSSSASSTWT